MKRCSPSCPRRTWQETADAKRLGWIRTTCGVCGGFIGYRYAAPTKPKRRKKGDDDGNVA